MYTCNITAGAILVGFLIQFKCLATLHNQQVLALPHCFPLAFPSDERGMPCFRAFLVMALGVFFPTWT